MNSVTIAVDSSTMTRISGPLGSNPAAVYEDLHGQRYYIKTLESVAHARNEFIAAKLYQLAGVPTFTYLPCQSPFQVATQWATLDKKCVAHLNAEQRKQAQRWFAVHAWMANWDVAGFNGDNQGVTNDGVVRTLDVGGALNFRAMGDPKGKLFATTVNEIDVLRSDSDNPHAVKLFADMDDTAILQSIARVVSIADEQIREVIALHGGHRKLIDKMLARKAYLATILAQH